MIKTLSVMILAASLGACTVQGPAPPEPDVYAGDTKVEDPYLAERYRYMVRPGRLRGTPPFQIPIETIEEDAEAGDMLSKTVLFDIYLKGIPDPSTDVITDHPIQRDYCTAANWIHSAAQDGLMEAQLWTAEMFRHGLGVEKDIEYAYLWRSLWRGGIDFDEASQALVNEMPELAVSRKKELLENLYSTPWWEERTLALQPCPDRSDKDWAEVYWSDYLLGP